VPDTYSARPGGQAFALGGVPQMDGTGGAS